MKLLPKFLSRGAPPPVQLEKTSGQVPRAGKSGRPQLPKDALAYYREAMNNPVVGFVFASATTPITSAGWVVESNDYAPPAAVELIEKTYLPCREMLMVEAIRAKILGYQALEKIWGIDRDGWQIPIRFKPLLAEATRALVNKSTGRFEGAENKPDGLTEAEPSILEPRDVLWLSYKMEAGNYYGRSDLESLRPDLEMYGYIQDDMERYTQNISGPILALRHPPGTTEVNGKVYDNADVAESMLKDLRLGMGVTLPSALEAQMQSELARQGIAEQKDQWRIEVVNVPTGAGAEYIVFKEDIRKMIAYAFGVPPRAIMEGKHGTLAEAETHQDVALTIAQQTGAEFVRQINWYSVDDVLAANFGEDARGTVWLEMAPIEASKMEFLRAVARPIAASAFDLFDTEALFETVGLPMLTPEEAAEADGDLIAFDPNAQGALDGAIAAMRDANV